MQNKNLNSNENRRTTDAETRIIYSQTAKKNKKLCQQVCSQLDKPEPLPI
jgi:hypothetical protein